MSMLSLFLMAMSPFERAMIVSAFVFIIMAVLYMLAGVVLYSMFDVELPPDGVPFLLLAAVLFIVLYVVSSIL